MLVNNIFNSQASGTNGGTFTSGAWQTRVLNTITGNGPASLGTNNFTLPAGTYIINAMAPALQVGSHQIRLRNTGAGTTVKAGMPSFSNTAAAGSQTMSVLNFYAVLVANTTFEIQHQCQTTKALIGFGQASVWAVQPENEIYTEVQVFKII